MVASRVRPSRRSGLPTGNVSPSSFAHPYTHLRGEILGAVLVETQRARPSPWLARTPPWHPRERRWARGASHSIPFTGTLPVSAQPRASTTCTRCPRGVYDEYRGSIKVSQDESPRSARPRNRFGRYRTEGRFQSRQKRIQKLLPGSVDFRRSGNCPLDVIETSIFLGHLPAPRDQDVGSGNLVAGFTETGRYFPASCLQAK